MYYLNYFDLNKYITGSTRGKLNQKTLNNIEIIYYPLETQEKIVKVLDKAQNLIDKRKEQINLLDELIESVFYDMFGDPVTNNKNWDTKKLSEITDVTSSKRIFRDEYVDEGVPFYRTKEIVELSKNKKLSLELFISKEKYEEISVKFGVPQIGDILISAVGTIGVIWRVNTDKSFYFKDGNLLWLKTSELVDVNSVFFREILTKEIDFKKKIIAQGAAYNALTIRELKEIEIPVPPLPLQNQFAEKVAQIEKQKEILTESLHLMEDNYNSLMQRAFKGELFK